MSVNDLFSELGFDVNCPFGSQCKDTLTCSAGTCTCLPSEYRVFSPVQKCEPSKCVFWSCEIQTYVIY